MNMTTDAESFEAGFRIPYRKDDFNSVRDEYSEMLKNQLQYLVFNNENIPMPASYSVSLSDVEADSGGVTEAGTTQRDVVREGVVQIGVTFRVSKKWLNKSSAYKKLASITVGYLDMETMNIVTTQMYIDGYQVKLISDTSYGSLWEVSFTLKEF